jgi:hypothetical protein
MTSLRRRMLEDMQIRNLVSGEHTRGVRPARGTGSIRAKMYGSGFHAMSPPGLEQAK